LGARTASKPAGEGPYDDFRILIYLRRRFELLFAAHLPRCETSGLETVWQVQKQAGGEAECCQLSKALLRHILMYMPNGSTI